MRTTLDLEPTALEAARQLALHRGESLGRIVSELVLKGLQAQPAARSKNGLPVRPTAPGTKFITLEAVKHALDDEAA